MLGTARTGGAVDCDSSHDFVSSGFPTPGRREQSYAGNRVIPYGKKRTYGMIFAM